MEFMGFNFQVLTIILIKFLYLLLIDILYLYFEGPVRAYLPMGLLFVQYYTFWGSIFFSTSNLSVACFN